jgi:hypothetical protein
VKCARVGAVALLASAMALPGGGGVTAEDLSQRWNGTYRYVGGDEDDAARLRAIERATEDMMFIARPIARRKLRDATRPYDELTIHVTRAEVTIVTDVRWTTPADGTPRRRVDASGDAYRVSTRFVEGRLVQRIEDDALRNTNTFRLSPDGRRMQMRVHIVHDRLPAEVGYRLRYRRPP